MKKLPTCMALSFIMAFSSGTSLKAAENGNGSFDEAVKLTVSSIENKLAQTGAAKKRLPFSISVRPLISFPAMWLKA